MFPSLLYNLSCDLFYLQPVYTFDEDSPHVLPRSNSCPELTMYRIDPVPIPGRRRTFSVGYDAEEARAVATPTVARSSSDTELDRIDREKSFETAEAYRRTTGLLAQVVGALAAVNKPPPMEDDDTTLGIGTMYGGYHGFSDSQILASEWSFPATNEMPRPRGRAASDFNLSPKTRLRRPTVAGQNEWTWSGDNDQIQEAINVRTRQMYKDRESLYRNSFGLPTLDDVTQVEEQQDAAARKTSRVKKFSMPDGFRKLFPFKKRPSQTEFAASTEDVEKAPPGHRKFSVVSVPEITLYQNPALDHYSTVTANASPSYLSNGQTHLHPSQGSLNQRLSNGHLAETNSLSNTSYQRNVPMGAARKRRDSIFAQKPAVANRRASLYPPAALNQRRGSLFTTERRGSTASAVAIPSRRGSLFPVAGMDNRRPSILSGASQENQDILENTTLADLIRALEAMHTQAVLDEAAESAKKNRKSSSNMFEPNPLLSLFGSNDDALKAAATNRLYARRSTIVGTLSQTNQLSVNSNNASNLLNRRRLSTMHMQEPPPSYTKEANEPQQSQQVAGATTTQNKFKRRFSVRPTALQIPPGKAPPPGVNISTLTEVPGVTITSPTNKSTLAPLASSSQTVLQRRLSLRPSPLATSDSSPTSPTGLNPSPGSSSSTTRLLPPTARPSTTSTHSPLSRIVQISQAQRKSSMPDGLNARKQGDREQ